MTADFTNRLSINFMIWLFIDLLIVTDHLSGLNSSLLKLVSDW